MYENSGDTFVPPLLYCRFFGLLFSLFLVSFRSCLAADAGNQDFMF